MIKRLVFGVAAGALALAPLSARADWFVNPEINIGVGTETGVGGAKAGISGGPIYTEVSFSTGDTETTGNIKIGGRF